MRFSKGKTVLFNFKTVKKIPCGAGVWTESRGGSSKIGVRHVEILLSQILSKHSVESLQMTLRYPTRLRKPPPTLPDAWMTPGRDFPEVDVRGEMS